MQILDQHKRFFALCGAAKKWGVYLYFPTYLHQDKTMTMEEWLEELFKAAPYLRERFYDLNDGDTMQCICDGDMVILCDTEEEMENIYYSTVGDDGPTELNSYPGDKLQIYALTCGPDGQGLNENT